MRWFILALGLAACDGSGFSDGNRSPCASGGQILGCEETIETAEDACWKLVQCGVFPVDRVDDGDDNPYDDRDFGGCLARIEGRTEETSQIIVECIAASSCDALTVNDSPDNAYEWPDCLEFE